MQNTWGQMGLVVVTIHLTLLTQMLTQGQEVGPDFLLSECTGGIPPTASLLQAHISTAYAHQGDSLQLVYADDSFPPVPLGAEVPAYTPIYRQKMEKKDRRGVS